MPASALHPVVAIAGDAGGAAALAPVLRRLAQEATVPLRIFGYREAPATWAGGGLDCIVIPAAADEYWLADRFAGASLLLSATSANGIDWERRAVPLARRLDVRSLAVLDYWSSYRRRFEDAEGNLQLPDRIAVMDGRARDEMAALGFPAATLVVTGQPALDALHERRDAFDDARRRQVRGAAGIDDDELMILYVSQPFADLYGSLDRARTTLGYDEIEVHNLCAAALGRLARQRGTKLAMAVRRHPRESGELPAPPGCEGFRAIPCNEPNRLDAVLAADLVLGMNSMLLMEAVLLGRIVVSVQPNLRVADPLPSNRDGRSIAVTATDALDQTLERALFDATWRQQHLIDLRQQQFDHDATARVVALANHLMTVFHIP